MKKIWVILSLAAFVVLALLSPIQNLLQEQSIVRSNVSSLLIAKKHYHHVGPQSSGSNLVYNGGIVMPGQTEDYLIFWEPTGSFVSPGYNDLITQYFTDVTNSSVFAINTQYPDGNQNAPNNAVLAGSWLDTNAYPSSPNLDDKAIQQEVSKALTANNWTPALNRMFFVYTAKDEYICDKGGECSAPGPNAVFCAYHDSFDVTTTDNNTITGATIYAALPYDNVHDFCGIGKSPNNNTDADEIVDVSSHEQMEAATDPLSAAPAWFDTGGNENGDKCNFLFGSLDSSGADIVLNGHPYILQQEWNNAKSRCTLAP